MHVQHHDDAERLLVDTAYEFYRRGWMAGTSGNLSLRTSAVGDPLRMAITASGADKGSLTPQDILSCDEDYDTVAWNGRRPSAETSIHRAIYRCLPEVRCVLHVHTVVSTCLSLTVCAGDHPEFLRFAGYEMVKGLGLWDPGAVAVVPVFPNWPRVPTIAQDVERYLQTRPDVPGFLIRGHGLTAWGDDMPSARKHLEVLEFLCACAWENRRTGPSEPS